MGSRGSSAHPSAQIDRQALHAGSSGRGNRPPSPREARLTAWPDPPAHLGRAGRPPAGLTIFEVRRFRFSHS